MKVLKKDGRKQTFSINKLLISIDNAFSEKKDHFHIKNIGDMVASKLSNVSTDIITTNIIERMVVEVLSLQHREVAERYLNFSHERNINREKNSSIYNSVMGLIGTEKQESITNENANKDAGILSTQRDLLAGILSREYALNHILPKDVADAHNKGEIHYHDLDYSPLSPRFNCMLVDVDTLFEDGFHMGSTFITKPKSIITAAALIPQIITQVASNTYGGTTINRIDEVLSPYAEMSYKKHLEDAKQFKVSDIEDYAEQLTLRDIDSSVQAMSCEILTMSSTGGQSPFCTFGFGLGTGKWAVAIQRSILEDRIKGMAPHGDTPVFPKLTFVVKEGLNRYPEDPNYHIKQLAIQCAAKRMYPDILNYDKLVEVTGGFKAPMGCRSFLGEWDDPDTQQPRYEGRNNLGVVSINLPRIALESNTIDEFWAILDERLNIAHKALQTRIDSFRGVKARVAPILYTEGAMGMKLKPDDEIIDLFKHGRSSISLGYIGIHEVLEKFYPNEPAIESENKQQLGHAIVKRLADACAEWKESSIDGWGYSLYSTPSESLCDRFCRLDVDRFGVVDKITDRGYYTNSFHLDVQTVTDPFTKIRFEKNYPNFASGGFISYVELPDLNHNLKAIEDIWDYAYPRAPYFGINLPSDNCHVCGFKGEFDSTAKGFSCPSCGNYDGEKMSVIRRVCGYLGAPKARPFNKGKQEEVVRRVKHA